MTVAILWKFSYIMVVNFGSAWLFNCCLYRSFFVCFLSYIMGCLYTISSNQFSDLVSSEHSYGDTTVTYTT